MPAGGPLPHPVCAAIDQRGPHSGPWTVLDSSGFVGDIAFLDIWQHWRAQAKPGALLHYVGLLTPDQARGLHASLAQVASANAPGATPASKDPARSEMVEWLQGHCLALEPGFHRLLHEGLSLTLCVGELPALLAQHAFHADAILAEAADAAWDKWHIKALARCCKRGTLLVLNGSAWPAPALLGDAGFELAAHSHGPWQTAVFNPRWALRSSRSVPGICNPQGADTVRKPGRCAIIGAGIAGASVARALALRGWQVEVLDSHADCAGGASGLPVGLVVPHHSADDSPRSRMSRSGTRLMLQHAAALLRQGDDWYPSGVLERTIPDSLSTPQAVDWQASAAPQAQGLWHAQAAWIRPAALVARWLAHPAIRFRGSQRVHGLRRVQGRWQLLDAAGGMCAEADVVVMANAAGCAQLLQRLADDASSAVDWVPGVLRKVQQLQALHGTLSLGRCPAEPGSGLPADTVGKTAFPPYPVNGHGSFISGVPTDAGPLWAAGSTFEADPLLHADLARAHATNFAKLQALLPAVAQAVATQFRIGQVRAWQGTRCVSYDRMPLVGPLEAGVAPTLWMSAGMGARGLSFSALCAELLAASLGAEPLPLESTLAKGLSTGRVRRQRQTN